MRALFQRLRTFLMPPADLPFEQQVFAGLTLLAVLVNFIVVLPANQLQDLGWKVNLPLVIYGAGALWVHVRARSGRFHALAFFVMSLAMLDAIWFGNAGSQGSIGMFFFLIAHYPVVFFRGRMRAALLVVALCNGLALFILEWRFPWLVTPFANPQARLLDLLIGFVICTLMSALMLWMVLTAFNHERRSLRKTTAALRESEGDLRRAQEAAGMGIFSWELPSDTWQVSPQLEHLLGIDATYPRSRAGLRKLILPEHRRRLITHLEAVLTRGTPFDQAFPMRRPSDGEVRWFYGRAECQRDAAGKGTRLLGTLQDITEHRKREEQLRHLEALLQRNQRLDSLGSLAGGVAHDMNNVMAAILGLADLHATRLERDHPTRKALETISAACLRGRTLVRGLLDVARQGLSEARPLDLNTLVREQVDLLARTALQGVDVVLDLEPGLPTVHGDAPALAHALMNLCVNASDAMASGGTLTLRTRNGSGGTALLQVMDTGCGMPEDVKARAMDPFFTTKDPSKGTGLGLSIVYATLKAHRGQVHIDSTPGQGTTITLVLPYGAPTDAQASAPVVRIHPPVGRTVLVVDDDPLVQESLAQQLEEMGLLSQRAFSAEEGLERLATGPLPDLVILDLTMPGMGGAACLPLLRARHPHLPVLLSTGRMDETARQLVRTTPHVWAMPKPYTRDELMERLREALEEPPTQGHA